MSSAGGPLLRSPTAAALLVAVLGMAGAASAQPADFPGSFEISGGALWLDGHPLGSADATLTSNPIGGPDGPFTLFSTATDLKAAPGLEVRVTSRLNRIIGFETGLIFARPGVVTRITGDAEDAADVSAEERLTQYLIDAGIVLHLSGLTFGAGRGVPFVTGGAGHLRQLHEGDTLLDTGWMYQVGGGVKYLLSHRPQARMKGVGLRADVRLYLKDGGFDLEDRRRTVLAAAGGLLLVF